MAAQADQTRRESCGTCRAFSALNKQCRRHPPKAVPIQSPNGKMGAIGIYPAVDETCWCLDWTAERLELGK